MATLTFRTPIWLSPPAKLKKLGVIEKIIASIWDEDAGQVDVDGILGESLISRQYVTPGQYAVLLLGNRMTLLGTNQTAGGHVDNRLNRAFESQSQYGNKTNWLKLESLYSGTITGGLTQVKLQQSATTVNGDDIIVEVTGTCAIDPQDEHTLLFTVDSDTVPTNTLDPVDAIINPLTFDPTGVANGTRYLLTEDIGGANDAGNHTAWGGVVAAANDIIEKESGVWIKRFDANFDDSTVDSTYATVQYVTNVTTGVQYKWTGANGYWVKSYEGFYEPGSWSIVF